MKDTDKTELTISATIARLRLIDDEMMRVALQDQTELVQYILRIIMRMPDLVVTRMETQKDIFQPGRGRSLILDVWAVDADGTQYNIEIQRDAGGAGAVRARYHAAVMDTAALRVNQKISTLPKTRIIFITEKDCIGDGKLLHRFGMRDLEDGTPLDTGQEIVYLNTSYNGTAQAGDEQLAALAHDFRCGDPAAMELKLLADRMQFLKDTKKGRTEMSSVIEQYARQEAEKAAKKAAKKAAEEAAKKAAEEAEKASQATRGMVRRFFDTGKHTPEELADLTGLSLEEVYMICEVPQV